MLRTDGGVTALGVLAHKPGSTAGTRAWARLDAWSSTFDLSSSPQRMQQRFLCDHLHPHLVSCRVRRQFMGWVAMVSGRGSQYSTQYMLDASGLGFQFLSSPNSPSKQTRAHASANPVPDEPESQDDDLQRGWHPSILPDN